MDDVPPYANFIFHFIYNLLILCVKYENEKAYKACQVIIEKKIMPKAKANYTPKMRNNRGIIIYDYRS